MLEKELRDFFVSRGMPPELNDDDAMKWFDAHRNEIRSDASIAEEAFSALRGKAIDAYANLEHSVCQLFTTVTGMDTDVAPIVFFKITTPRFLYVIIQKLLKKRYGDTYITFWNSLSTRLDTLSQRRNSIVHWTLVARTVNNVFAGVDLRPGYAIPYEIGTSSSLNENDLSGGAQNRPPMGALK